MTDEQPHFSFAKLALYALGAGVLVLLVSIPIILGLAQWSPVAGLVAALVAVIAMIAAIGTVSNRMVNTARDRMLAARARDEAAAQNSDPADTDSTATTDRNTDTHG